MKIKRIICGLLACVSMTIAIVCALIEPTTNETRYIIIQAVVAIFGLCMSYLAFCEMTDDKFIAKHIMAGLSCVQAFRYERLHSNNKSARLCYAKKESLGGKYSDLFDGILDEYEERYQ